MSHICDVTYSICWICNYVGDICDIYVVLVRVHSQLVAISHDIYFQFSTKVHNYAYDLGPISSKFSLQK